jgi:hypothetical protein
MRVPGVCVYFSWRASAFIETISWKAKILMIDEVKDVREPPGIV